MAVISAREWILPEHKSARPSSLRSNTPISNPINLSRFSRHPAFVNRSNAPKHVRRKPSSLRPKIDRPAFAISRSEGTAIPTHFEALSGQPSSLRTRNYRPGPDLQEGPRTAIPTYRELPFRASDPRATAIPARTGGSATLPLSERLAHRHPCVYGRIPNGYSMAHKRKPSSLCARSHSRDPRYLSRHPCMHGRITILAVLFYVWNRHPRVRGRTRISRFISPYRVPSSLRVWSQL